MSSELLTKSLLDFYAVPEHGDLFLRLVSGKSEGASLRMLDWFVTDYAKRQNVTYTSSEGRHFVVHVGYKSGLKGFRKKFFDPFCRTERTKVVIAGKEVETTIAQMNFVRWCIQNDVLAYVSDNVDLLRQRMKTKPVRNVKT